MPLEMTVRHSSSFSAESAIECSWATRVVRSSNILIVRTPIARAEAAWRSARNIWNTADDALSFASC
jgi:hypothetical protein